jgi:hypothetical protein
LLESFILPAAKVVEKASEAHDVATVVSDASKVAAPLLQKTEFLGPLGAAAAAGVAYHEYKTGEISGAEAIINGGGPVAAWGVGAATTATTGAAVGTGVVVIKVEIGVMKAAAIWGAPTFVLRPDVMPPLQ